MDHLVKSKDNKHVYWFGETWDTSKTNLVFIRLSPILPYPNLDKTVVKKCKNYAKDKGFGGFIVTYLYSHTGERLEMLDPYTLNGPQSDEVHFDIGHGLNTVVASWGKDTTTKTRIKEINSTYKQLYCLGTSKSGLPLDIMSLSRKARLKRFYINI